MNGVHDMGGMQGFGPVVREANEPVFHAPWEGRVMAIRRALIASGKLSSTLRPFIESIPPADYLRMSYYELWFTALVELVISAGLARREEVVSGLPAEGGGKAAPVLSPAEAAEVPFRVKAMPAAAVKPGYAPGQRVRARNINPLEHTRLPRYVRGRAGIVERDQGIQLFPDTEAYGRGDNPQHVYSVRFPARELWGEEAPARDSVYLDLWEDYLEPA